MSLINNGKIVAGAASSTGFEYPYSIDYAGKFDGTALLNRTEAQALDDAHKFTLSFWCKILTFGVYQYLIISSANSSNYMGLRFATDDALELVKVSGGSTDFIASVSGDPLFRDPSHWYHIVVKFDSTEASEADRLKISINGVEYSLDTGTTGAIDLNENSLICTNTYSTYIGRQSYSSAYFFDGYMADFHFIDGAVVEETSFGEFKYNTWVPKQYSGNYGTQGFYLDFADSGNLGDDESGNTLDLTNTNVVQTTDTPTNNYPTLDSVLPSTYTVSEAGLKLTTTDTQNDMLPITSLIPTTGKWRVEVARTGGGVDYMALGVVSEDNTFSLQCTFDDEAWIFNTATGLKHNNDGGLAYGSAVADNVPVEILFDADTGELSFVVDDVDLGVAYTVDTSKRYMFAIGDTHGGNNIIAELKNGAEGFTYERTGYLPICTANWPASETPVIDSEQGLWIPTYVGDQPNTVSVLGSPFDVTNKGLVWLKDRDVARVHVLVDAVRGSGKRLFSHDTAAEDATSTVQLLEGGFSVGDNTGENASGENFITWVFNMLSQYGMDIVAYTGDGLTSQDVAHNLADVPEMIIVKRRDSTSNWLVGTKDLDDTIPWNKYLLLQSNAAVADATNVWNDTEPTTSIFTVGSGFNVTTATYIAYLFRSIPGFLKVGYYIGNGSADGPRIYTGFRPRYILFKIASSTGHWFVYDTERSPHNLATEYIHTSLAGTEEQTVGYWELDFLSSGFKIRNNDGGMNANGDRYIYLAIGDPFPYVNAF